jgi:hypothetical protein
MVTYVGDAGAKLTSGLFAHSLLPGLDSGAPPSPSVSTRGSNAGGAVAGILAPLNNLKRAAVSNVQNLAANLAGEQ